MVVLPGVSGVTTPLLLTVATVVLLEVQVAEFVTSSVPFVDNVAVAVS
jgi:hypothetical protein